MFVLLLSNIGVSAPHARGNIKKCVKVFEGGESFYIFLAEKTKKKGDATHGKEYR